MLQTIILHSIRMSTTQKSPSLANPIYWPAWLALGTLWLITRLPFRLQLAIGEGLGKLLYLIPSKLKHITEVNINLCFPEMSKEDKEKLMKKNFASLGIGLIEAAMAWWLPDKKLNTMFHVTGLEHLDVALARGKGIILLGPHFTCLEIIGRILSSKYSFAAMYRPHKKPLIAFIQERYRNQNVHYIPRHRVRELLRALNKNMAIWYAYDVDGGEKSSVFAPFFGIQTASLTSVSRIKRLSDATIVPIQFFREEGQFKYEVVLSAPIENFPSDNEVENATRLNASIEMAIRAHPEQYVWQYKRFKTRPSGEKRFY